MTELQNLTKQRDDMLIKIREIETNCEGIENENNARRVSELNMKQAQITASKNELTSKLTILNSELSSIAEEIRKLSGTGIERILDAIKTQRWFFFKNKPKVLMDKTTGYVWANLNYFPWKPNNNKNENYSENTAKTAISKFDGDGIQGWKIPKFNDFKHMITDKSFPFCEGNGHAIKNEVYWYCNMTGISGDGIDLGDLAPESGVYCVIPYSTILSVNDYSDHVSPNNPVYTETERLQFTLNLFVENGLWPIFEDEEITQLYKQIYFEKPPLVAKLAELQAEIEKLQEVVLLSSTFDYTAIMSKYNITEINSSVIKYTKAVCNIVDEFMDKLNYYEDVNSTIINDFNVIGLKLLKKYDDNDNLTEEENKLLENRQLFFKRHFALGMENVNAQLLSVKAQAESIEDRIDDINNSGNTISELAKLERGKSEF